MVKSTWEQIGMRAEGKVYIVAYKYSKARVNANRRYNDKAYERLYLWAVKGRKEIYKELADREGKSLSGWIFDLLDREAAAAGLLPETETDREEQTETD